MNEKQKALLKQLGVTGKLSQKEKKRFKRFDARRQAILDAIEVVPSDGDTRFFRKKVGEVETLAKGGKFKEAYLRLEKIESDARAKANGYAHSFTTRDLEEKVTRCVHLAGTVERRMERLDAAYAGLATRVGQMVKASSFATLEEAALFLKEFAPVEQEVRTELDLIETDLGKTQNLIVALKLSDILPEIRLQLKVLGKENPGVADEFQAELAKLPKRQVGDKARPPCVLSLCERYDGQKLAVLKALSDIKDVTKWQQRDSNNGAGAVNPKLLKAMENFEAKHQKLLKDAGIRLLAERLADKKHTAQTRQQLPQAAPPETFDVSDIVAELPLPQNLKNLPPEAVQMLVAQTAQAMDALTRELVAHEPEGDELFDLALKTPEQLRADLARTLGIDPNAPSCGEDERALLNSMAEEMVAKVRENYPNKASAGRVDVVDRVGDTFTVPQDFTLNGTTYGAPKYLASGGLGHVLRYEDQDNPGQFVVLKTLRNPQARDEMVHELQMHRQAAKGGHPNVIGFKGLVYDGDGVPFLAMENATGGSMQGLGFAVGGAAATGVLSEEARHVLAQHVLKQAVQGLAHVQASNLVHRDIKVENYLLGEDGTVKAADFGSVRRGDAQGATEGSPIGTTATYAAPENFMGGAVTGKADTYSLGATMAVFADPHQGMAPILSREGGRAFQSPDSVTAFDRLRNAMLNDDPAKRPTLEAVQHAVYLTDAEQNYDAEKVQALLAATMAYSKNMPRTGRVAQEKLLETRGKINNCEQEKRKAANASTALRVDQEIAALRVAEAQHLREIQAALEDPTMRPYVEALEKASADLGGRGSNESEILPFEEAFKKSMAAVESPYVDPEIVEQLALVDAAQNPEEKRRRIGKAIQVLDKCAAMLATSREELVALASEDGARERAERAYVDRLQALVADSKKLSTSRAGLNAVLKGIQDALAKEQAAEAGGEASDVDYTSLGTAFTAALADTPLASDPHYESACKSFVFLLSEASSQEKRSWLQEIGDFTNWAMSGLDDAIMDLRAKSKNMARTKEKEAGVKAELEKAKVAAEMALKESEVASAYRSLQSQLRQSLKGLMAA